MAGLTLAVDVNGRLDRGALTGLSGPARPTSDLAGELRSSADDGIVASIREGRIVVTGAGGIR